MEEVLDTMDLSDDHLELLFDLDVEGEISKEGNVPPFYIRLNIHDLILHNAMLDSGASHNLMPKVAMEKLGLDITSPYKDLFSFDTGKVSLFDKGFMCYPYKISSQNFIHGYGYG